MKKWLSLAAVAALAVTFTACSDDDNNSSGLASTEVSFAEVSVPTTNNEQNALQSSSKVTVDGVDQTLSFTKLMATGDSNNGEKFGAMKDMNDDLLTAEDGSPILCNGTSNSGDGVKGSGLDYTSILQKNGKLYMVSQFECQVGAMYKAELEQSSTGVLSVKDNSLEYVSQKEGFGGFVHCAGQTTPWQSHLGSEEYETDARFVEDTNLTGPTGNAYYDTTVGYWGDDYSKMNPYYYGWVPEVSIDANGDAAYAKHYSMGRFSHELSFVMPDNKTVYQSDDGTNVAIFKYIADTAKDLSAGTLYAAKWTQTNSANGGSADISWVELGHATDAEIKAILDPDGDVTTNDGPVFSDIFATVDPSDTGTCATGYTSVNTTFGNECLKVKDGMEKAAAFLESRRYAGMMGATTEFRKMEGITYSPEHKKLFIAMSAIAYGMEDNMKKGDAETKYDIGESNDIKLPYNACGAVYSLDVDSSYNTTNMTSILVGTPMAEDAEGNTCRTDGISNPDNVTMLEGTDLLTIGEDTGAHINNMIWTYNLETNELTRILTTPLGAETTSPFWYKNINGYSYMTAVTQHPDETTDDLGQSSIGVMGPIKNIK
jgi:secreted PhoX family phosphatase